MNQPINDLVAASDQGVSEIPHLVAVMAAEIRAMVAEGFTLAESIEFVAIRWKCL